MQRLVDAVLDASIYYSFDRTGLLRHQRRFAPRDLDVDMSGRVCVVTGANSGLGREVARGLAQRRADVWLVCRNEARGREARAELLPHSPDGRVFLEQLDVSDLAAVRAFARRFPPERIDVLMHNAGLIPDGRVETAQGLELTLATHVVGPYLLSQLLEPRLRAAGAARVIFVSSGGMYTRKLSLDDIDWRRRPYDGVAAYAQTKRMQVVLAELMAEQWQGRGIGCHAMHPGWADTPGVENSLPNFWKHMAGRLRSPAEGADTALWLAVAAAPGASNGGFWFDRARVSPHYLPFTRESAADRRALLEFVAKTSERAAAT